MSRAESIVNGAIVALLIAIMGLALFILGTYYPSVSDERLKGLEKVSCDDIIRYDTGRLVCEVNMQSEDDNLHIYKGRGTYE